MRVCARPRREGVRIMAPCEGVREGAPCHDAMDQCICYVKFQLNQGGPFDSIAAINRIRDMVLCVTLSDHYYAVFVLNYDINCKSTETVKIR